MAESPRSIQVVAASAYVLLIAALYVADATSPDSGLPQTALDAVFIYIPVVTGLVIGRWWAVPLPAASLAWAFAVAPFHPQGFTSALAEGLYAGVFFVALLGCPTIALGVGVRRGVTALRHRFVDRSARLC